MARKGYKLASYKLPEDLIESLKAEAERRGTSQTALLVAGLRYVLYMESGIDSSAVEAVPGTDQRIDLSAVATVPDIDQRIEIAIAPILAQMEALKAELQALHLKIANQPQHPQNLPSENDREALPRKTPVRSIVRSGNLSDGLSERALAKRVKADSKGLRSRKFDAAKLAEFIGDRDPDGIEWEFRDGKYYPLTE